MQVAGKFFQDKTCLIPKLSKESCKISIKNERSAGWLPVTDEEYKTATEGKPIYNGCSLRHLHAAYGADNIKWVPGVNWFRRTLQNATTSPK